MEDYGQTQTNSFDFDDLTEATKYEVQVRVNTEDFGVSEWSVPIEFKTIPAQLTGKI